MRYLLSLFTLFLITACGDITLDVDAKVADWEAQIAEAIKPDNSKKKLVKWLNENKVNYLFSEKASSGSFTLETVNTTGETCKTWNLDLEVRFSGETIKAYKVQKVENCGAE